MAIEVGVVSVEELQCPLVGQQPLEIVERKGLDHSDFICDGVMEHAFVALARLPRAIRPRPSLQHG
jgi:S-adenosylmethionine synthetase